MERNCQFQFIIHNEAQQEKVRQVERPVKHSKRAQICKRQFCWNSHENNEHWLWPVFTFYRRSTRFNVKSPKEAMKATIKSHFHTY